MKNGLLSLFRIVTLLLVAASAATAQTLAITAVEPGESSVSPGDTVVFTITVTNTSDTVDFGGGTSNFTISLNSNTATSITFAAVATGIPAIAAGAIGEVQVSRTIPISTSQASAYFVNVSAASADLTSSFTTAAPSLTVVGNPDFEVTSLTYPAGVSYEGGDVISMSLTYINRISSNGTNNVPYVPSVNGGSFFRIEVVLSSNPKFGDADDFLLTFHDVSTTLDADGVTQTINWNQLLPGNFAGSYYVLAKIDTTESVDESIEADLSINGNNTWFDVNGTRIALAPTNFPTIYWASSGGDNYSDTPSTSEDGRYSVFASDSTNLVGDDANGNRDIFVYDRQTDTIRRLSVSGQGSEANGYSYDPAISLDATKVAFSSEATNLILGDTNGFSDIFVVSTFTGAISRVSVASDGTQANGSSFRPAVSEDGRYIVFESTATNLVTPNTTFGVTHIYLRDTQTSTTTLISQTSGGTAGNGSSTESSISADGQRVAYSSLATNLVAGDGNAVRDVFVRDVSAGTTVRVSVDSAATEANGISRAPSLSGDGTAVAFASFATNLVAADTNGVSDIFVHTIATGTTTRVSVSSVGTEATDPSGSGFELGSINPSLSSDGRFVAFASIANNLTDGDAAGQYSATDANNALDIFVHDRDVSDSGTFDTPGNIETSMVSRNRFGFQTLRILGEASTAASDIYPSISADGRWIAFPSDAEGTTGLSHGATNRTSSDSNDYRDIFLFDRRSNALPNPGSDPTVNLTAPLTGSSYAVGSNILLVASAAAPAGTVSSVQFFVDGTSLTIDTSAPYTASWLPSVTGTYSLSALVEDRFGNQNVSENIVVTINATSPTLPTVTVTNPVGGSSVPVNTATTLTATATDADGTIAEVEFFANGVRVGDEADTVFPYSATWNPSATGTYAITAVAKDDGGNTTTSAAVAVTVDGGGTPVVTLTSPAGGASLVVNSPTTLSATAVPVAPGTIAEVEFLANGVSLGAVETYPYSLFWTPTATGTYSLLVIGRDSLGNVGFSAASTITVAVGSGFGNAPTVSITSPAVGTIAQVNTSYSLVASATDTDGTITSVAYYDNGVTVGDSSIYPYAVAWTPLSLGTHSLTAVATDNSGNTSTSAALAVQVTNGSSPVVVISLPTDGDSFAVGDLITFGSYTSLGTAGVVKVQYFVNDVGFTAVEQQLESSSSPSYFTYPWRPAAAGTYVIRAVATDRVGNTTTSAPVTIQVRALGSPSVSIVSPAGGAILPVGVEQFVTAEATSPNGSIISVQFFSGSVDLGFIREAPFRTRWNPTPGTHELRAVVTDSSGVISTSAPVTVTASLGAAPTVTAVNPGSLRVGDTVTLQATAADADGVVELVEFYLNDVFFADDSTYPYTTSWPIENPGTYFLTARAIDNLGNVTISAAQAISVLANLRPVVSLTDPGTVVLGNTVTLSANASDADGSITQVEFWVDGVSLGVDATAPYSFAWTPAASGSFSLTAVVTDDFGDSVTSSAISVVVPDNQLPTSSVTTPVGGSNVALGRAVSLTATATDADGTIAQVEFFADGVSQGIDTTSPYTGSWTPVGAGSVDVTVVATDNLGGTTTSAAATINVLVPPTVSISSPANGAVLQLSTSQQIAASASAEQSINTVTFFVNGEINGSDDLYPYATTFTPRSPGNYTLTAVVTDNVGLTTTSSSITVSVPANLPPSDVFVTNPVADSNPILGLPQALAATASDLDGTVTQVEFFVDGISQGVDTAAPYTGTWTPALEGAFVITVVATDDDGSTTTSPGVSVQVLANEVPTVDLTTPVDGARFVVGQNVELSASATDPDGSVAQIEFFVDGVSQGVDTTAPYTATWTPAANAAAVVTAVATDNLGDTGQASAFVTVAPPTLEISNIVADPTTAFPGEVVRFTLTVDNIDENNDFVSNGYSADIALVLSSDDASSIALGSVNVVLPSIASGASEDVVISFTIPTSNSENGSYFATANASGGFAFVFTTESEVLDITGVPDLAITGLSYPASIAYVGGDVVPFSLAYTNLISTEGDGNVPYIPGENGAEYFRIQVVLSSNAVYGDADDFTLTFFDISSSLAADGIDRTITWDQLLPGNFAGSYYVLAKIDSLEGVDESAEESTFQNGNNVWYDVGGSRIALEPTNFPAMYWASKAGDAYSDNPSTSADGRYTVYASDATTLVDTDTNGTRDIFLYDRQAATVRRLNVSSQGVQANGLSQTPAISNDASFVAFSSEASNLVTGDTNGFSDIYVVSTTTGLVSRVSLGVNSTQSNGSSFRPTISADGRYIAFESTATNLIAGGTAPGISQIYRFDRQTNQIRLVSASVGGAAGSGASTQAKLSGNGELVVFASAASNLVAGDSNAAADIFVRDMTSSAIMRVSVAGDGTQANGASRSPAISTDGSVVAFASAATNLVPGDANGISDIFVHSLTSATTVRVSVSSAGGEAFDPSAIGSQLGSMNPSLSADGRYVAFVSLANNLTDGDAAGRYQAADSNEALDVFVHDRDAAATGTYDTPGNISTTMVSRNRFGYQTLRLLGQPGTAASNIQPVISADGRWVAFPSDSENTAGLVHGATNQSSPDSNNSRDIFLHDRRINADSVPGNEPTVAISNLSNGGSVPVNVLQRIEAVASPVIGSISTVDFFVNGAVIGTDAVYPYTAEWTPTSQGTYLLTAAATDSSGNIGVSTSLTITVALGQAPIVTIVNPPNGDTYVASKEILFDVTASDPDGTITQVELIANGQVVATDPNSPYFTNWVPDSPGIYTLTARATDNSNNVTTSAAVIITVTQNVPASITLFSPADGSSYTLGSTIVFFAEASDANGTIDNVRFLNNGDLIGEADTTEPYTTVWKPGALGTYSILGIAVDNDLNAATSPPRTVTVKAPVGILPTVGITSPAESVALTTASTVPLIAGAFDQDGTIASVAFFDNGVALGSATTAPYFVNWTPPKEGAHRLVAVVTDNSGNIISSAPVDVQVAPATSAPPTVVLANPGTASVGRAVTLQATASDPDGIVTNVEFRANGVALGDDSTYPFSFNWTPAVDGTYQLTALARDDSGNVTSSAHVLVTVTPGSAPTVSISNPGAGFSVALGSSALITATAADVDGVVSEVAFYINNQQVSTIAASPFNYSWTPTSAGAYTLYVEATDDAGNTTRSTPVSGIVTAVAAPTVTLLQPTSGSQYALGPTLTLVASISGGNGAIKQVDFFANGSLVSSDETAPFTASWTPTTPGTFSLVAVATDNAGISGTSAPSSVVITPNLSPSVTLTSPASAMTIVAGGRLSLSATASDTDGVIQQVRFLANGVSVGSLTSVPYVVSWSPLGAGTYAVVAEATDDSGNVTTTAPVSVTVNANTVPTVRITAPTTGSALVLGNSTQLTATASDADGSVASVEFLVNGLSLASVTTAPYRTTWTPQGEGVFRLTAVAIDNAGAVRISSEVAVVVLAEGDRSGARVYSGNYVGQTQPGQFESGQIVAADLEGISATFILIPDTGTGQPRFYTEVPVDLGGGFSLAGQITGQFSSSGVTGTVLDGNLSFIAPITSGSGALTTGLFTGNLTGRFSSEITALVGSSGTIAIAVKDGTSLEVGKGSILTNGTFSLSTHVGSTITGKLDLSTGFLTGTVSGGSLAGGFTSAVTSGGRYSDGSLRNISTRGKVGTGDGILIAGFVVGGEVPKKVLIRAIGPTLSELHITTPLADPVLTIFQGSNAIASNDDWAGDAAISAAADQVFAFTIADTSKDAALLTTLSPGIYTAQVTGKGATGVALVEAYDVDVVPAFGEEKVLNISTRGEVGTGEEVLIAGFVINGSASKRVLIRAVGPTLSALKVNGVLADPILTLIKDGIVVRENSDWEIGNNPTLVNEAASEVFAFPLPTGSKDAVLLVTLPPGIYTAQVRGAASSTGVALIEVYEVP